MTKSTNRWVQYALMAGLALFLLFTDLGKSVVGSLQQLILQTGFKNAPIEPTPANASTSAVRTEYPYELKLSTLDGEPAQLSDLAGKVVFLNQWATWCPPCRAEMPAIEKLYLSLDKNKVAFVMLSLDEDVQKAKKYIDQKGFTFPVYVPAGPMPDAFLSQAIPTTFILDPNGQIVQRIEGMANYNTDEFRNYLPSLHR